MAKKPRLLNPQQKAFAAIYDEICYRHSRWTVWSDFVMMAAASISNMVDTYHAEARESLYMQIVKKYSAQEVDGLTRMLAEVHKAMLLNGDQDFLGEMFTALNLHDEHRGQIFTPYHLCKAMAKMVSGNELKARQKKDGWISVLDPACGAGALLIAFANECMERG